MFPNNLSAAAPVALTPEMDAGLRSHMLRIYNLMTSGLLVTAIVAWIVANTGLSSLFYEVVRSPRGMSTAPTVLGWVVMFAPLAFILVMSFGLHRLSRPVAGALFWAFAAVMGLSMANIFSIYTGVSIATTFFLAAAMFAGMSLYGYTTGADLSKMGSILLMALIGIILASIVNIFIGSSVLATVVSIIGIVVFCGLTAWDTQRIRNDYFDLASMAGTDEAAKRSIMDALGLYLSFINLFQLLLQFMGQRQE
jgi:FtsH-binding integral membrane protein